MRLFDRIKYGKFAKENNLTIEEVLQYNEMNQNGDLTVARFKLYLLAKAADIPLKDYEVYFANHQDTGTAADYKDYLAFNATYPLVNLSFEQYMDYRDHYQAQFDPSEYKAFVEATNKGLNKEEATAYAKEFRNRYSISRYKLYLAATAQGLPLEEYERQQRAKQLGLSMTQLQSYDIIRNDSHGFSDDECMEYARRYSDLGLARYYELCQANKNGITLAEYDEWKTEYSNVYTLSRFTRFCKARQLGMTLEDYEERLAAKEKGLSLDEYRLYQKGQKYGLNLDEFRKCAEIIRHLETRSEYCLIDNLWMIAYANRLKVKKIVLDTNIGIIPDGCFQGCPFEEIILPHGITKIGSNAFKNCTNLREICIPGSVQEVPGHIFDGCTSLKKIMLLEGIRKVNITGWCYLPALKSVASACTIPEFEVDKDIGYVEKPYLNSITQDEKQNIRTLSVYGARQSVSNEFSMIEHHYSITGFPNLETMIITSGHVSSISIKGCPKLKVLIVQGINNSYNEYYKNGNIKKTYGEGEYRLLLGDDFNNDEIRFIIIKEMLKEISCYGNKSFPKMAWLHVPESCTSVAELDAPNLTSIGATSKANLPSSINDVILTFTHSTFNPPKSPIDAIVMKMSQCELEIKELYPYKTQEKSVIAKIRDMEDITKQIKGIKGTVEFMEGTRIIPKELLKGSKVQKIQMPFSLNEIKTSAFENCKALSEIRFRKYPGRIDTSAFWGCKNPKVLCDDKNAGTPVSMLRIREIDTPALEELQVTENSVLNNHYAGLKIRKAVIDSSVKSIGKKAFANCKVLESIVIKGDPKIAEDAFEGSTSVQSIIWKPTEYKKIAGNTGFPNIQKLDFQDSATAIRDNAFEKWGLESVVIPPNISAIGEKAFLDNKALTKIVFLGSVKDVASDAFQGCTNVSEIDFGVNNCYHIAGSTGFPKVENVRIQSNTSKIAAETFFKWGLKEIEIPESVRQIGKKAFASNKKLKKITIMGDPEIAEDAFSDCREVTDIDIHTHAEKCYAITGKTGFPQITSVTIPAGAQEIPDHCYEEWGITEIDIPASVQKIGSRAFASSVLEKIVIHGNPDIAQDAFENCLNVTSLDWNPDRICRIAGETGFPNLEKYEIPENAVEIASKAFYRWGLETVIIPQSVLSVGEEAFAECMKLKTATYCPEAKIGKAAFSQCRMLQSINKNGKGVFPIIDAEKFGADIFDGCISFNTIHLDKHIDMKLARAVISSCGIKTVYIAADLPYAAFSALLKEKTIENILPEKLDEEMREAKQLKSLPTCPGNIKKLFVPQCIHIITDSSLENCVSLSEIILSPSVTVFDSNAFVNCSKISKIKMHQAQRRWLEDSMLPEAVKYSEYGIADDDLFSLEIVGANAGLPEDIPEIRKQRITHVIIDEGCVAISDMGFANMSNLRTVEFKGALKEIGERAFNGCVKIQEISLPDSIAEIGEMAFMDCSQLETIHLPRELSRLRNGLFKHCVSLSGITGMDHVSYVEEAVFDECTSLQRIVFSSEIFSVKNCFSHCRALKELVFPIDMAELDLDLSESSRLDSLYLPQSVDSFRCVLPAANTVNVHALRGSTWKNQIVPANVTYYKKADMQDKLDEILSEAGYHAESIEKEHTIESIRQPSTATARKSEIRSTNGKQRSRAGWSTRKSQNEEKIVFSSGPEDVDEMVRLLTENDEQSLFEEQEINEQSNRLTVKSSKIRNTTDTSPETITSNIFTVHYQYHHNELKCFRVCLTDKSGIICSSVKEIRITHKGDTADIKVQLQTKPGISNGTYYSVVYAIDGEDIHILNTETVTIDISFVVDDEFSF